MNEFDLALIERYLRGELNEAEREAFETRMAADEAFQREVDLNSRALAAVNFAGLRDLKKNLQEREVAFRQSKKRTRQRWLLALLTLFLMTLVAYWLWKKGAAKQHTGPHIQTPPSTIDSLKKTEKSPSDNIQLEQTKQPENTAPSKPPIAQRQLDAQKLFAEAFQPYRDASLNPSVRNEESATPFEQFLQLYWENQHPQALAAFENLSPALRGSDDALFLKANSLLATGQTTAAAALFEAIQSRGESRFAGQAEWYLALCFLKNRDLGKAKKQLERLLSKPNAPQRSEAQRLLRQIR
jgi:hypothetical protein